MSLDWLVWLAVVLAAIPAGLGALNIMALRTPRLGRLPSGVLLSICIPARDEALNIGDAVDAARAAVGVPIEIVVMDDGSTDGTGAIVSARAEVDPRVRLEAAPPLPPGWAGKAHACHALSTVARGTHLLFVDADVRLEPEGPQRLLAHALAGDCAFVSGVPRQLTPSWGERLTVPLIDILLLGYLPVAGLRRTTRPEFGAACGQLMLVQADAYRAAGGHAAEPRTLHDGLRLARTMRRAGFPTDLVRGAELARCRMYEDLGTAWRGFGRNAGEGMATWAALPFWTLLLAGGHVLPVLLAVAALAGLVPAAPVLLALALAFGLRLAGTLHGRGDLWAVPLHPATVLVGLAIQWNALLRRGPGRAAVWKGRTYQPG